MRFVHHNIFTLLSHTCLQKLQDGLEQLGNEVSSKLKEKFVFLDKVKKLDGFIENIIDLGEGPVEVSEIVYSVLCLKI